MEPTVRRPVDLPGSLQALGAGGNLVFTLGNHWQPDGQWTYDNQEWVDAVAYDGVEAHLVASLKLPVSWPHPIEIGQEVVWLGRAPSSPDGKPSLESWKLNDQGEFALLANLPLAQPADSIRVFGSLLASQGGNTTQLFDIANPASPGLLTTSQPEGCLWANLNSAVGEPGRGVWFPVGLYGVQRIPRPTRD
jgi:hypothetical protein